MLPPPIRGTLVGGIETNQAKVEIYGKIKSVAFIVKELLLRDVKLQVKFTKAKNVFTFNPPKQIESRFQISRCGVFRQTSEASHHPPTGTYERSGQSSLSIHRDTNCA
jgi:hypothetical protein